MKKQGKKYISEQLDLNLLVTSEQPEEPNGKTGQQKVEILPPRPVHIKHGPFGPERVDVPF